MTTAESRSGKYLATAAVSAEQWPVGTSALLRCVAEIVLNYDQDGACGAAGPASAAGSALTARPPHAGPHRITPHDQPGSLNTCTVLDATVFFDCSCLARRGAAMPALRLLRWRDPLHSA
jgi:hypothetical protein